MLKRMVISNFKCFKNKTVFDFRKTNYKILEQNTHGKILKGALFVGGNASGKTTAVQPIKLLLDILLKDQDIELVLYSCLFSASKLTHLKYEFEIDGHDIHYSFSFEGNSFAEEKLEVDKKVILERLKSDAKLYLEQDSAFHEADDSILFLKRVYFNTKFAGNKILIRWFEFLKRSIYIDAYLRKTRTYGGENLNVKNYIEKYGVDKLNMFFQKYKFDYSIQYERKAEGGRVRFEAEDEEMIFFRRLGMDVPVPLFMESVGNKTLINILPAVLSAVENGGMLVIDEFSSGFHNKLEELLVKYIMKNGETTQLFFVSHSTNLLSNSILRPDQIYSVEMAGDEGSYLYRFSEEQPRAAQNLEKMYLSGVFGGVPEYGFGEG